MLTTVTVILAASVLLLLGIVMSAVLGWAANKFHVPVDIRIEEINDVLPGANCGGCGYVGCNEYAE
ncbi:MAG: electron transporter RnfB, partial [Deltaproteobacteria bacterium]|nr:electron transporter RnfB [Deltaproteobacteria bacterium]